VSVETFAPELDLSPRIVGAVRAAMSESGGDPAAGGKIVREHLTAWANEMAQPVADAMEQARADLVVTSLFGVEVLDAVSPQSPWVVINSTFYVGEGSPRPLAEDFGARAIPLFERYSSLLQSPDLVLHATDSVFDFSFQPPARNHYVGPLGIWEPSAEAPAYVTEPGDPWVLVAISSQLQDDLPIADAAIAALAERPVRVLVTVGPDHDPGELSSVPSNVRVERTVSHAAVLDRSTLFVSHAGHGSVMKALWKGRPMVLVPWGRDQPGVAARAAALGVAVVVPREEASTESIRAAVDQVLSDESVQEAVTRHSARLQASDPGAASASLLESLL
jgi:hypothetical protein